MKLDKIDEVCIHFLSDVFGFFVIQKFCSHDNVTKQRLPNNK